MSEYNQTLGNKISTLRKEHSMTQDQLATALSVTFQAVSKWENGLSCPDIALIPKIADLFSITLDELFGREAPAPAPAPGASPLPWEDDGKLRAALFIGHRYIKDEQPEAASDLTFEYDGPALSVESALSVRCGDVGGPVSAGRDVECKNVTGNISAGRNVVADELNGNVSAGGSLHLDSAKMDLNFSRDISNTIHANVRGIRDTLNNLFRSEPKKAQKSVCVSVSGASEEKPAAGPVTTLPWEDDGALRAVLFHGQKIVDRSSLTGSRVTLSFSGNVSSIESAFDVECGNVAGDVTAGGDVDCGEVGGNVSAGGDMDCGEVHGNASAGGDMDCGSVGGHASAGGDLDCGDVGGNASAGGDLSSGNVSGGVSAGGDVNSGDVEGNVNAEGDVNCGDVSGSVSAGGDLSAGNIGGIGR